MSDSAKPASPVRRTVPTLWRLGVCAMSAGLLAGSYHPFSGTEGVWFGLAPLLVLARFTPPATSFGWGWVGGFGFWAVNLWWFLRLGDTGVAMPVAVLGWLALSAYAAVYTAIFLLVASESFRWTAEPPRCCDEDDGCGDAGQPRPVEPQSWTGRFRRMLLLVWLPVVWVGAEWLRSALFTGFPWNTLGVSQFRATGIIQLAAWGGVYAVSALIVLVNASVAIMAMRVVDLCRTGRMPRLQVELAAALIVIMVCLVGGRTVARSATMAERAQEHLSIVYVQPAIPQVAKWDSDFCSEITGRLDRLTSLAAGGTNSRPDMVIWPETSIPVWSDSTEVDWLPFVQTYATNGVPLLVGVLEFEPRPPYRDPVCYNNAVLVDTNGAIAGRYTKRHLVPFGEYIPTASWIPLLKRIAPLGFSCEPGKESTVFRLEPKGVSFSALICFEDIFADLSRTAVRRGAQFLVNQTNDAWFDDTAAHVQHMSHAVFRCVENRVAMVRVANTGVSCFIDRKGEIQDLATAQNNGWNLGTSCFGLSALAARGKAEEMTFYTRWGDWGFAIPCTVAAAAAFFLAVRRIRRERKAMNAADTASQKSKASADQGSRKP